MPDKFVEKFSENLHNVLQKTASLIQLTGIKDLSRHPIPRRNIEEYRLI